MTSEAKHNNGNLAAIIFAAFAVVCIVAFLTNRGMDIGRLPYLLGSLGGGPLFGLGLIDSLMGVVAAFLVLLSWFGTGLFISRFVKLPQIDGRSHVLELVRGIAMGAATWSLVWFVLGLSGFYKPAVAAAGVIVGVALSVFGVRRIREADSESRVPERAGPVDIALLLLIAIPVVLALISSMAPPIAKDTLLYHFSVPKAYLAQGSNAYIQGNIASYLALGTEMHVVWARLLGGIYNERSAEVAGSVVVWTFFPLLLAAVFGWAREGRVSRRYALVAVLTVAAVPTAYYVASSGYIDVSLALFINLAIYSLWRWWREPSNAAAICIAIYLGAALGVKLTTVFAIAAFVLVVLLRARGANNTQAGSLRSGRIAATGFAALLFAGVIASPWYLRTWAATGSPVFPFYMSIWPGKAEGWDVERSNLFQAMNSQYGGTDINKLNLLTAPVRLSVVAQPEQPANYDGVLGVAFLIGLPLLGWALWKFDLGVEIKIMAGVAGVMYLFWLFSSEQLRYLLPISPLLAIAIAASAEKIGGKIGKVARCGLVAASVCGLLTVFAWFCQKAPLRAVFGGEMRDGYLSRNLDYYPYYQEINTNTAPGAKVWLINMRRDTYNIERPVISDYLFEDWTLRKMVWESQSYQELKAKTAAMGVQYVLTRHDFLFDYDRSSLVDDKKPRAENEAKLKIAKDLILDPANTVRADNKFSLIKVF